MKSRLWIGIFALVEDRVLISVQRLGSHIKRDRLSRVQSNLFVRNYRNHNP